MKLARQKRVLDFFSWLIDNLARQVPGGLLKQSLFYACVTDSHLDVEAVYHKLETSRENEFVREKANSIAEQLMSKGRSEGRTEGLAEAGAGLTLRQARRIFGEVPEALVRRIRTLPYLELEELADAIPDLSSMEGIAAMAGLPACGVMIRMGWQAAWTLRIQICSTTRIQQGSQIHPESRHPL